MALQIHREDVKAVLRKRFGSVFEFERVRGLPPKSVSDVLRGRTVTATAKAIAEELGKRDSRKGPPSRPKQRSMQSDKADDSTRDNAPHRLSERGV